MPGNDNWNCVRICAFEYIGTKSGIISKITGGEVVLLTTVIMAALGFLPVVCLGVKFSQEAGDFLALKSAVATGGNAVCLYSSVVTPSPQGVRMDMEEPGYFPDREHVTYVFTISHIFSRLLFN